jgi:hypothetical protein
VNFHQIGDLELPYGTYKNMQFSQLEAMAQGNKMSVLLAGGVREITLLFFEIYRPRKTVHIITVDIHAHM